MIFPFLHRLFHPSSRTYAWEQNQSFNDWSEDDKYQGGHFFLFQYSMLIAKRFYVSMCIWWSNDNCVYFKPMNNKALDSDCHLATLFNIMHGSYHSIVLHMRTAHWSFYLLDFTGCYKRSLSRLLHAAKVSLAETEFTWIFLPSVLFPAKWQWQQSKLRHKSAGAIAKRNQCTFHVDNQTLQMSAADGVFSPFMSTSAAITQGCDISKNILETILQVSKKQLCPPMHLGKQYCTYKLCAHSICILATLAIAVEILIFFFSFRHPDLRVTRGPQ